MLVPVKYWAAAALGSMVFVAYGLFYLIDTTEAQGATSFGIANTVGLVAVFVGLVAFGLLMRRFSVPR